MSELEGRHVLLEVHILKDSHEIALPKTNLVPPENRPGPERKVVSSLPTIHFQVQAASFREGTCWIMLIHFVTMLPMLRWSNGAALFEC